MDRIEMNEDGNGKAFYVGAPAWHKKGFVFETPPSVGLAMAVSGMDHSMRKVQLGIPEGCTEVPGGCLVDRYAVLRDDGKIVGIVGDDYQITQPAECFEWFQPFLDSGDCTLEAGGFLREGSRMWVLAKINDCRAIVLPNDPVEAYVLLAQAFDGTLSHHVGFTAMRVECDNILTAALGNSRLLKIKHTVKSKEGLALARDIIDVQKREFAATAEQFAELTRCGCDDESFKEYARLVLTPERKELSKRYENALLPKFQGAGIGLDKDGMRGTGYGAFNALTEYATHDMGNTPQARADSVMFGKGAGIVARALEVAKSLFLSNPKPVNSIVPSDGEKK